LTQRVILISSFIINSIFPKSLKYSLLTILTIFASLDAGTIILPVAVINPDEFIVDVFNVPLIVVIEPSPPILIGSATAPDPVPILIIPVVLFV
jgi:hypothetical protein